MSYGFIFKPTRKKDGVKTSFPAGGLKLKK
jgi:hypothetical protein